MTWRSRTESVGERFLTSVRNDNDSAAVISTEGRNLSSPLLPKEATRKRDLRKTLTAAAVQARKQSNCGQRKQRREPFLRDRERSFFDFFPKPDTKRKKN